MLYDFDRVINRYGTESTQWDLLEYKFGEAGLLPFWMADMDFECSKPIIDALLERTKHGIFGYTKPCTPSYIEAIQSWYRRRCGWKVESDWIVYVPNVIFIMKQALALFTIPGDKVIIQTPVYNLFERVITRNGRYIANSPLKLVNGRYEMDFNHLESLAKDPAVKAMILCNPHNPVGRLWSAEELSTVGEICVKNDVLIISDEIHADFHFKKCCYTPLASLSEKIANQTITCTGPTKSFNISGLMIANAIIPNGRLKWRFEDEVKNRSVFHSAPVLGVVAMKAAYNESEEWLEQCIDYVEENMDYMEDFLAANLPKVKLIRPEATYFAWLDFREYKMSRQKIEELLWHTAKVAAYEGTLFGPGGEGFIRFICACPRSKLEEGLRRIQHVFKGF